MSAKLAALLRVGRTVESAEPCATGALSGPLVLRPVDRRLALTTSVALTLSDPEQVERSVTPSADSGLSGLVDILSAACDVTSRARSLLVAGPM